MIWFAYTVLFVVVMLLRLPADLNRMRKRGGYRCGFMQRFGCYAPDVPAPRTVKRPPRFWIHAVSVGEMFIALRMRDAMRQAWPDSDFVITTNTSTGHALASTRLQPGDTLLYFPLDLPCIMQRAFKRIDPALVVLMECELWPNLLRTAARHDIPVVVANARLSDRSFAGYRKVRFLFRRATNYIAAVYAQTPRDAERFRALGMPADRVMVVGNAKYDLAGQTTESLALVRTTLDAAGITDKTLVVLGGSTWPGEEETLMDMLPRLRNAVSNPVCLVLAPRHVERRAEIIAAARRRQLKTVTRRETSEQPATARTGPPDVLLIDTTGELQYLYAAATVVFIGKSLHAHGGQSPIEPAVSGCAIIAGPHMENFTEVTTKLLEAGGLVQIADAAELERQLISLLNDPRSREQLGRNAAGTVIQHRGAIDRTVQLIAQDRTL